MDSVQKEPLGFMIKEGHRPRGHIPVRTQVISL